MTTWQISDRVYVGSPTRPGTVTQILSENTLTVAFDHNPDMHVPFSPDELHPFVGIPRVKHTQPKKGKTETQPEKETDPGVTYVCVKCRTTFFRERKLDTSRYQPRCPSCLHEDRKASKRATWATHKTDFLKNRKTRQRTQQPEPAAPEIKRDTSETPVEQTKVARGERQQAESRVVDWRLRDGRKIVWMADPQSS